jgi:AraC-like DNA-binding protein
MIKLPQTLGHGHQEIDPRENSGLGSTTRVDQNRRDFVAGLPLTESESVQLGRGTATYTSRRIWGRDLVILSYRVAPRLAIQSVPRKDWVVLIMSLNERSEFVFNGQAARPFDLFLSAGGDGYMSLGKDRCNIAIGMRRTRLIADCAALAGVEPEDIALRDLALPAEQDRDQRLRRALTAVAAQFCKEPLSEGEFEMPQGVENDLTALLAARVVPAVRRGRDADTFRIDALRVVRAATAASKSLPACSLADLCRSAGVSQRWLHKCFVDVVGVSPYRYIRLARLSQAREQLLSSERRPAMVKCLALSLGYRLSGRFAADYRSVFDENPSDTLGGSLRA